MKGVQCPVPLRFARSTYAVGFGEHGAANWPLAPSDTPRQ
jgi:hypothetical protein